MDIQNNLVSNIRLEALQKQADTLLTRLAQAGLFRALVLESRGQRVVLDTAYGQLTGKAPPDLRPGDVIQARLLSASRDVVIKIEQHQPGSVTLNHRALNQLVQQQPSALLAARVVADNERQNLLQLGQQRFAIPRQTQFQVGDTLLVKAATEQSVTIQRAQPEILLKQALQTSLLPRGMPQQQQAALSGLQKLASQLLQMHADNPRSADLASSQYNDPVKTKLIDNTFQSLPSPSKNMLQLLQALAKPLARIDHLRPATIQQILSQLTWLQAAPSTANSRGLNIPEQLIVMLHELRRSDDSFQQLLRALIQSNRAAEKVDIADPIRPELSTQLRSELSQQIEQSLAQLLTQKVSLRLQIEQNLPLQFHINLPVQVDQQRSEVKLKLQQKKPVEADEEPAWEIDLSFEFGLLGLISTRLLLQGTRLSASFWAAHSSTKILIESQLGQFQSQLKKSGFELGLFDCFLGQPKSAQMEDQALNDNLVDIKV